MWKVELVIDEDENDAQEFENLGIEVEEFPDDDDVEDDRVRVVLSCDNRESLFEWLAMNGYDDEPNWSDR